MKNQQIRDYANSKHVRLWEVAARLKLTDGNFSRRLRFELSDEEKNNIVKIIDEIATNREDD